ncbi:hypothetical protein KIH87_07795 [Paraneptunicella aestuarii]|nr:hypothetical protein KIH87_07795 [Paraneptunicella aestuarii]
MAATSVFSVNAQAQQKPDWWFDIEVIVFKRNIDGSQLTESFPFALQPIEMQGVRDLLTPYLHPDISRLNKVLPNCYQQESIAFPKQTAPAFSIDESVFEPLTPVDVFPQYHSQASYQEQGMDLRGGRAISNEREEQLNGMSEEERQIQSLQMAFSMPDERPGERPGENPDEVPETAQESSNTIDSGSSSPESFPLKERVQTASYSDNITTSENAQELDEAQEASTPQAIYDAMTFQTEKQQYQLAHWEIPADLGCSFSNNKPRFWLNDVIDPSLANPDLLDYLPLSEIDSIFIESVPNIVDSFNRDDIRSPYLLPASQLALKKLARDINRMRGLETMLHLAWRQPVKFGPQQSPGFRLIAGKNYGNEFAYNGYPMPPEMLSANKQKNTNSHAQEHPREQSSSSTAFLSEEWMSEEDKMLNDIKQALAELDKVELRGADSPQSASILIDIPDMAQNEANKDIWELDGMFRVYLQNIGRTPYLHIDSKLNFRQPMLLQGYQLPERILQAFQPPLELPDEGNGIQSGVTESNSNDNSAMPTQPLYFLKPYHFQQLRRVISRQMHYFDHPMFGMVVQIRRYKIPDFMNE